MIFIVNENVIDEFGMRIGLLYHLKLDGVKFVDKSMLDTILSKERKTISFFRRDFKESASRNSHKNYNK